MTHSGDDEGFHPHPGDPWHPEWTEDAVPDDTAADVDARDDRPPKQRRGWFRRKTKNDAPPTDWPDLDPGPAPAGPSLPPAADAGWDEIPATVFTPGSVVEMEARVAPAADEAVADDGPRPAWLTDSAPEAHENPTLEVELPSWVGDTTVGAGAVSADFDDRGALGDDTADLYTGAAEPTADQVAPELETHDDLSGVFDAVADVPAESDLEVALRALGAMDEDVDVVPLDGAVGSGDDQASLFDVGIEDPSPNLSEVSPEAAAAASEYGVAGKEAFEALRDIHAEDLGEWEEFAAAQPAAAAEPGPESDRPRPEAFDQWHVEEQPRKRGIWPFRRRRDEAEEQEGVIEESAEWIDDGGAVPAGWFADIDEDEVVPPPADLPETEYPEAATGGRPAAAPIAIESEPPADGGGPAGDEWPEPVPSAIDPAFEPRPGTDRPAVTQVDRTGDDDPAAEEGPDDGRFIDPSAASAMESGGWHVPAGVGSGAALEDEVSEPAGPADDKPVNETPWAGSEVRALDDPVGYRPAFDPGAGFDTLPELEEFDAGAPKPLRAGDVVFRSPTRSASTADRFAVDPGADLDDDDEWTTGPIDLGDGYDDATVELPAGYGSVDDITEQIYTTSATMEHRGFAEELTRSIDEDTEWQAISAAMPGVGTGVVGFDDVADLGDDEDVYLAPTRSELGTRVLTGLVLVGFLVGSVLAGGGFAAIFIGVLVSLGLGEFYGTLRHRGFRPLALFGYVGGIGLFAATWFHGPVAIPVGIGLAAVLVFFVYAFAPMRRDALTNGGLTILGVAWVMGTAAFAVPILRSTDYKVLVLAIVVATAAMDIGAYSVGRTWGARALAPVVSPNKSVEGLIGGIVACMAAALAVGYFIEPFDLKSGIALGIVVCVAAPIGDLAESMFKRSLGVKDMGAVLPGHGGILDRIDAFLFVLPAAWVLFTINGLLG